MALVPNLSYVGLTQSSFSMGAIPLWLRIPQGKHRGKVKGKGKGKFLKGKFWMSFSTEAASEATTLFSSSVRSKDLGQDSFLCWDNSVLAIEVEVDVTQMWEIPFRLA